MFHKNTIIEFANNIKWFYDMLDELAIYLKKYERVLKNVKRNNYDKNMITVTPIDSNSNRYIIDIKVNKSEFKFLKDSKLRFDTIYKTARNIINVENSKEIELTNNYYLDKRMCDIYNMIWKHLALNNEYTFLGVDNSTNYTILRFKTNE